MAETQADAHGDALRNVPFTAPWAENLKHRENPNRVSAAESRGPAMQRASAGPAAPPAPSKTLSGDPVKQQQMLGLGGSYYDVSMLKQPLWKWEIATYFFLGGLSAGAYILSRLAERQGGADDGEPYRDLTRIGTYLALASFVPCPGLLIHDLGDPKRFHHMLRVFKPSTPMNLGTWSIVGYSGMAAAAALCEYLRDHAWREGTPPTQLLRAADRALLVVHDAAGIPFALLVAGYTGVLLSCTSNPLWCKNPWLGPLFSASAIATGAEAISLAMDCTTPAGAKLRRSQSALRKIDTVAHAAELACMAGFMRHAGDKAATLRRGKMKTLHRVSIGGIIAAELLKLLPTGRSLPRPIRMLIALLGLGAGFSLRWSLIFGGHEAAADPATARLASDPRRAELTNHKLQLPRKS